MTYNWTDNCCESGVAQCDTDVLNENLMHLKYDVFEKIQEEGLSINDVIEALYPVGAIYIGVMNTCPLQTIGIGTWTLKSRGRVLQGSDGNHNAGTTIDAGLPNITGSFVSTQADDGSTRVYFGSGTNSTFNGAFKKQTTNTGRKIYRTTDGTYSGSSLGFDASLSNNIYGSSSTVQPPAYVVNIWERTA